jgi:hypothetical protein
VTLVSLTATGGTTETRQEDRPRPNLRRYELRIRTGVSRALAATFRHRADDTVIRRNTARRLRIVADTDDIPDVLRRLTECDVDLLELRVCRLPH